MEVKELRRRIMEVLEYDPETGLFRWKVKINPRCADGWFSGSKNGRGYMQIQIDGKLHIAHRLAWLIVYGKFPSGQIDHEDQDRCNNKIRNLRDATRAQNQRNKTMDRRNMSGESGVFFDSSRRRWIAGITVNNKRVNLGRFIRIEDAIAARREANIKYGFHPNHGRKR